MSDKLIKQPNMVLFWIVLAGGLAVIVSEKMSGEPGGALSILSRTVFWCAAVAYFSLRIYQFVSGRKKRPEEENQGE